MSRAIVSLEWVQDRQMPDEHGNYLLHSSVLQEVLAALKGSPVASEEDPYGHRGKGGVWGPGVGQCLCDVCDSERRASLRAAPVARPCGCSQYATCYDHTPVESEEV